MLFQKSDSALERRVAIVVASKHHGNTLKIAEAIAVETERGNFFRRWGPRNNAWKV